MTEDGSTPDTDDLASFRDECRTLLAAHFPPRDRAQPFRWGVGDDRAAVWEEADPDADRTAMAAVRAWRRLLWDHDLGWISGPTDLGGRGLTNRHQAVFDQEARGFAVPGNAKLVVSLGMVAPTIAAHGTPTARRRHLPGLHAGDIVACQLFSEPEAGSDLAAVAMRARRSEVGWRLTGQKVWTSGAQHADIGLVLCRTSDGPRHHDLTAFVVDLHAPGVEVRPLRQMTGGAAFNEVFLTDVAVADDDRLGEIDGGWTVAMTTLANERRALGGEGFGGSGLLSVERYRQMARALGRADDPLVRQQLADLVVHLRVAKLNQARAAAAHRRGAAPGPEGSLGKLELANNYARIGALVGSVLGPRLVADGGDWGTYAWAEFVLGVPGMRIGGGTDEVHRNALAERILGLPRS